MSFISGFIPDSLRNYGPTDTQSNIPVETPVLSLLENALTSKAMVAFLITVTAASCISQAGAVGLATPAITGFTAGMILWNYYPKVKAAVMIVMAAISAYFATKTTAEAVNTARNLAGAAAGLNAAQHPNPIPRGLHLAAPPNPTPEIMKPPVALGKPNTATTIALRDTAIDPTGSTVLQLMNPNEITEIFRTQCSWGIPGALTHLNPDMVRNMVANHAPGTISGPSSHASSIVNSIVMVSERSAGFLPGTLTQLKPGTVAKSSPRSLKASTAAIGIMATAATVYVVYTAYQHSQAKSLTHTEENGQEQQSNITQAIVVLSKAFPKASQASLNGKQDFSEVHVTYAFETSSESGSQVTVQKLENFPSTPFISSYGFRAGTTISLNQFKPVSPSEVLEELPELTEVHTSPPDIQTQELPLPGFRRLSPSDLE